MLVMCWGVGLGQSGQWTWLKGDSSANARVNYGIKGISSISNDPGGRQGGVSWTDASGNFWIFGGFAYRDSAINGDYFNDLWKYDPIANVWTWMKGDSVYNKYGVYGVKGNPDSLNNPGARTNAVSWSDAAGNLWLFGGGFGYAAPSSQGYGMLNDLWKYTIATNKWTWVNGDSTTFSNGHYGIKGVEDINNLPKARYLSNVWNDDLGNLWLYGGINLSLNIYPAFSYDDLWKFNLATNKWTWVNGDTLTNQQPHYGIKGIASLNNNPGGRLGGFSWKDNTGNLLLFGGESDSAFNEVYFNDVWKYSISLNEWTWIKGDSTHNVTGEFGASGVPSDFNNPSARSFGVSWADSGNCWVFGGSEIFRPQRGTAFIGNDLWKYNSALNQWTWISGDSTRDRNGVYQTYGTPNTNNKPGAREQLYAGKDLSGNFILFGGTGYAATNSGYLNDLWKFTLDSTTFPLHLLTFTAKRANTANLLNWTTAQEVNTDRFEIERSSNGREFSKIGTVKAGNTSYSFADNNPVNGANYYRLKMADKDGAFTYSPIRQLNNKPSTFNIALYPNPAKDKLQLQVENDKQTTLHVQVVTQDGKVVLSKQVAVPQGASSQSINISQLAAGHYFLKVLPGDKEPVVIAFEKTL